MRARHLCRPPRVISKTKLQKHSKYAHKKGGASRLFYSYTDFSFMYFAPSFFSAAKVNSITASQVMIILTANQYIRYQLQKNKLTNTTDSIPYPLSIVIWPLSSDLWPLKWHAQKCLGAISTS